MLFNLHLIALGLYGGAAALALQAFGGGMGCLSSHTPLGVVGLALRALALTRAALSLLHSGGPRAKRSGPFFPPCPPLERLDSLNRSALGAGFPALTAGVLLAVGYTVRFAGGIHVDKAQVVWGLFTWLVVGAAGWLRGVRHWAGRRAAGASHAAFAAGVRGG